jgi:hypothetical protein
VQITPPTGPERARVARDPGARVSPRRGPGIGPAVLRTRVARATTTTAALAAAGLALAVPASAQAPSPEIAVTFSVRSLLSGDTFTMTGVLPGGAADAGRPLEFYEQQAPFPGTYALTSTGASGPNGEFSFSAKPARKAYWAVVAPQTATQPREASSGFLVAVRRKVSIRTSTRRPRHGSFVRFSGFVSPSFPVGPGSVATLQRRNRQGGFTDVESALLGTAGSFSSYRFRARVNRSGVYRVVVPASTFYSTGASVGVTLHMHAH